jgi:hypothetical protein
MAGLIAKLLGGKPRNQAGVDPLPGQGGYQLPPGPANQTGFPGSTSQVRTLRGNNPRIAEVRSDTNTGFEQELSQSEQVRQASYRGDVHGAATASPRATPNVATRQPVLTVLMQQTPATNYGGPMLKTGPGNNTAGGQPLGPAAAAGGHSGQDTQTPWRDAQPQIGVGIPGATNVRNQVAQRYKARPEDTHTYKSAPRPDNTPVLRGGQAVDGNVKPDLAVQEVTVPSRFVFEGGGNQTWSVERQMPYGGVGNGARGAHLNGQRYYAAGQGDQFGNAGQGEYGQARKGGGKRPVAFTEPAPWTSQYYDTTSGVESASAQQAPSQVYVSPPSGRASNSTGRSH